VRLGFASDEYSYLIDLGYPPQERGSVSVFVRDPEIKQECIWFGPTLRPSAVLVERNSSVVRQRGDGGEWTVVETNLPTYDSMMLRVADPRTAPEVIALRESIRNWRFYDHFRADAEAPARGHPIGTRTPILSNDGRDLAAAIATIREIGDVDGLEHAIDDAFPRSRIEIYVSDGRFALKMHQHGLLRALDTAELSDGTLRYLLWIAALLTPRPPALMVLNEPETSLHPDLLPALARLIARASEKTQVIVVSHAQTLIAALAQNPDCRCLQLEKNFGETQLAGQSWHDTPAWRWPKR
jgi:predicted ATPase